MTRSWIKWMALMIAVIIMDAVITYIPIPLDGFWFMATVIGLILILTYVLIKMWDLITAKNKTPT